MIKIVVIISLLMPMTGDAGVIDWFKSKINKIKEYKTNWKKIKESKPVEETTAPAETESSYEEPTISDNFPGTDTPKLETANFDFLNEMRAAELQRIKDSENFDDLNQMRAEELQRIKDGGAINDTSTLEPQLELKEIEIKTKPFKSTMAGGETKFDVDVKCYEISSQINGILYGASRRLNHCLAPKDYKAITGVSISETGKNNSGSQSLRIVCDENAKREQGDVYLNIADFHYKKTDITATKVFKGITHIHSMPSSSNEELKIILSKECYGCCHDNKAKLCQKCINEKSTVEANMANRIRQAAKKEKEDLANANQAAKLKAKLALQNISQVAMNSIKDGKSCDEKCMQNIYSNLEGIEGASELYENLINHTDNKATKIDEYTRSLVEHITALTGGDTNLMKQVLNNPMNPGCYQSEDPEQSAKRDVIIKLRKKMSEDVLYKYDGRASKKGRAIPIQDQIYYLKIKRTGC